MKVTLITNIPTPYRDHLFSLLCKNLEERQYDFGVYYTDDSLQDREWSVKTSAFYHYLKVIAKFGKYGNLNSGLVNLVRNSDILIVGGYEQPTYIIIILLCKIFRKKCVIFFDGIAPSRLASNKTLINLIKRNIVGFADIAMPNGKISLRYFQNELKYRGPLINQLLCSPIKTQSVYSTKDIFDASITRTIQKRLHMGKKLVTYCGRFIERKNIIDACRALSQLDGVTFVLAGSGVCKAEIIKACEDMKIDYMDLGHLTMAQVQHVYTLSSCIVLPASDEPWGLVVHEAIQLDLPVVISDDCGCHEDLIINGKNGFVAPVGDVLYLAKCIETALTLDKALLQHTNKKILDVWNIRNSVDNFLQAINYD